jgi:membrane-associated phospholipid phosphatase
MKQRIIYTITLTVAAMSAFWVIGYTRNPEDGYVLRLAVDDWIPFWPWTVVLYSWAYTSLAFPLFVVRDHPLFRRIAISYAAMIGVSLLFYAFFPVTAVGFRPEPATLPQEGFLDWVIQLTFFVDPPTNLFPSLHMSAAVLSMLCAYRARWLYGLVMLPVAMGIALSICTLKQHYIVDGFAGAALSIIVYFLIVHFYKSDERPEKLYYGWSGVIAYFFFHGLFYLSFVMLYMFGYRPWA